MARRSHYVALSLVLLLVVLVLSLPDQATVKFKLALSSLFLPLFGLAGSAQGLAEQAGNAAVPRRVLIEEAARLKLENQRLRLQAAEGEAAQRENARLRALLGWQSQNPLRLKAARVVGRDTANWWRSVRIDRGTRDGLKPDLPVLTAEGLVGRVGQVGFATAEVILVGDPKCRVSVVVRETGENGVLSARSSGVLDHRWVDLTHLPRNTALKPGQTVATSGLGGVFPPGIAVGTVVDSRSVGYGLYTEARVRLTVDSSRLSEVMVMLP
jgi:rod shape-determining protein MreC